MAKKNRKRTDRSGDPTPLVQNPFAALAGLVSGKDTEKPRECSACTPAAQAAPPYTVEKTRKGHYALSVENRGGGKKVTLLRGVTGDAAVLLTRLRKYCGTGGSIEEDAVLLQGDQREKITQFLNRDKP